MRLAQKKEMKTKRDGMDEQNFGASEGEKGKERERRITLAKDQLFFHINDTKQGQSKRISFLTERAT